MTLQQPEKLLSSFRNCQLISRPHVFCSVNDSGFLAWVISQQGWAGKINDKKQPLTPTNIRGQS